MQDMMKNIPQYGTAQDIVAAYRAALARMGGQYSGPGKAAAARRREATKRKARAQAARAERAAARQARQTRNQAQTTTAQE